MPFGVNDLTVGFEDALASFLEARLEQANLDFEDAQAVCWRHREGSIGWTVSVRRSVSSAADAPSGSNRHKTQSCDVRAVAIRDAQRRT